MSGSLAGFVLAALYAGAGAVAGAAAAVASSAARGDAVRRLRERRGYWDGHREAAGPWIWIQAASVGEAEIGVALARATAARLPGVRFVVSSMTDAGRARAAREDGIEPRYFPIDYAPFLKRILEPGAPLVFVAVETEIWPATLALLQQRGVPTAVVNARLSDESMPRYARVRALLAPRLAAMARICARDEEAAARWRSLGARDAAVEVTGNIKFDLAIPRDDERIPQLFERSPRPLLLAASTHEGEDEQVLEAFSIVRSAHPDARLLLAPRHPRRAPALLQLARARWLAAVAWSDVVGMARASKLPGPAEAATVWPPRVDAIVLDRLGLLRSAYASSQACFVGGSWVEGPGGHNLLEPAVAGCPISTGPRLGNVADQVAVVSEAGALRIVREVSELSSFWLEAIERPRDLNAATDRAQAAVRARGGALERSVDALLALVPPAPVSR